MVASEPASSSSSSPLASASSVGIATPCCGCTFNSWDLHKRIDYVFVRRLVVDSFTVEGFLAQASPKIESAGGVADMKDRLFPSDHLFPHLVFHFES